jgi:N-acetylglucosaminyldiphosphoundecaprenol N-acetyl-beta-D-mannosaminyltransferase
LSLSGKRFSCHWIGRAQMGRLHISQSAARAAGRIDVAGVPVDLLDLDLACAKVARLLRTGGGGYVIFRDMHGIVRAADDPQLRRAHRDAALVMPDGMPLVWIARGLGFRHVGRVYGPDFLLEFCRRTEHAGYRHYFYGSTEDVGAKLAGAIKQRFPGIEICGRYAPPFAAATDRVSADAVERIRGTGANIVWVGLGTPKQELWMRSHTAALPGCVLLGVGAAFDFHAKTKRQAPRWMRHSGLEWSFRLLTEPRRLGRRYLVGIPRFLGLLARHGCRVLPAAR